MGQPRQVEGMDMAEGYRGCQRCQQQYAWQDKQGQPPFGKLLPEFAQ
ncbi:hypothetical protein ACIGW4_14445 [Streptomyces sp. NPDC053513]